MTFRVWIFVVICVLVSPLLYTLGRYLLYSPFMQPYLRVVVGLFAVPEYIRGTQQSLTDFGSGLSLLVVCDRANPECVTIIPRLETFAVVYSGLSISIVTMSDHFFSTSVPQIQKTRFTGLPNSCPVYPQFLIIKSGNIIVDSCYESAWVEKLEQQYREWNKY